MEKGNAFIIAIGDELTMGQIAETNSEWIAQHLDDLNIRVMQRAIIPDNETIITECLKKAVKEAEYIFLTGGLGPTKDDMTKQILSDYFQSPLIRDEATFNHLNNLCTLRNRPFTPEVAAQAMIPENCEVLPNATGTAPGMYFKKDKRHIFSLPGVPYETMAIFEKEILPIIKEQQNDFYRDHRYFLVMNMGETEAAKRLKDIENSLPNNVKLAYLPGMGVLKLRLTGEHPQYGVLQDTLDKLAQQINETLGNLIAGTKDEPIEYFVGQLLKEKQLTLGLAESCTGGLIAHRLTNIPGSSAYFKGSVVSYANEVKENLLQIPQKTLATSGAVSEVVVRQMAKAARQRLNTDISLSVSGILGPGGGSPEKPVGTVWMALSDEHETSAKCFHFHGNRLSNKIRTANIALEWVRKWLTEK